MQGAASPAEVSRILKARAPIKLIGLTGGIATGKSTAARFFAEAGASVIDADKLSRRVVAPGTDGWKELRRIFGDEFIGPDGHIDRCRLGRLVFSEPTARAAIEAIIHPKVKVEAARELGKIFSENPDALAVYDVPLLFEANMQGDFDIVAVVYAPRKVQKQRLAARNGIKSEEAERRISSQLDVEEKVLRCHVVLDNSGESDQPLKEQVGSLIRNIWADRKEIMVDK